MNDLFDSILIPIYIVLLIKELTREKPFIPTHLIPWGTSSKANVEIYWKTCVYTLRKNTDHWEKNNVVC